MSGLAKCDQPRPDGLRSSSTGSIDGLVMQDELFGSGAPIAIDNLVVAVIAGGGCVGISVYKCNTENTANAAATTHHQFFELPLPPVSSSAQTNEIAYNTDLPIHAMYDRSSNHLLVVATTTTSTTYLFGYEFDHKQQIFIYDQTMAPSITTEVRTATSSSSTSSVACAAFVCVDQGQTMQKQQQQCIPVCLFEDGSLQIIDNYAKNYLVTRPAVVLRNENEKNQEENHFVDLSYLVTSSLDVHLYAARAKGSIIIVRGGTVFAPPTVAGASDENYPDVVSAMQEKNRTIPGSTGPFQNTDEILQLNRSMEWNKLTFSAHGPPGQLRCSKTMSGTSMRWRAQTAYASNSLRPVSNEPAEQQTTTKDIFSRGLHINFKPSSVNNDGSSEDTVAPTTRVVDSGQPFSSNLRGGHCFGWMKGTNANGCFTRATCSLIYLIGEWRLLVPQQGEYYVSVKVGDPGCSSYASVKVNDVEMFDPKRTEIPANKCCTGGRIVKAKRDAAGSYYICVQDSYQSQEEGPLADLNASPVEYPGEGGSTYSHLISMDIRLAEGITFSSDFPAVQNEMRLDFVSSDMNEGQEGDLGAGEKIADSLLAPPALLRQHTDLLGARKSAYAAQLEWELDLDDVSLLGLLDVCLELKTEELTSPVPTAHFGRRGGGGILCPLDRNGRIQSSRSWSVEAWIKPEWNIDHSSSSSSKKAPQLYTLLFKSTSAEENNLPQFELVCDSKGGIQMIIYNETKTKLGKGSSKMLNSAKLSKFMAVLNPRITNGCGLKSRQWTHVAATLCANSSGRAELSLYMNGDFVSADFLSSDKYRPVSDDDDSIGPLRVGCAGYSGSEFCGHIRHVRYWAGARTQTDIRDAMHTSTPSVISSFDAASLGSGVSSQSGVPSSFSSSPLSSLASSSSTTTGSSSYQSRNTLLLGSWPLCSVESQGTGGLCAIVGKAAMYTPHFDFKRKRIKLRGKKPKRNATNIVFNVTRSDSRLKFSNDNTTASCSKNHQYQTAMALEGFTSGAHYWEIQVDKASSYSSGTHEMFVGVGEFKMSTKNCFVGQQANATGKKGWGYYSRGQKYAGTGTAYGKTYGKKGDVIGVLLDMDQGTLGFTINGKDQGIAYNKIKSKCL